MQVPDDAVGRREEGEEEWDDEETYEGEEEYDESSDDELLPKALPIEGAPSFDDGPPTSAEEYLRQVRWEAKQLPKVVCAKINLRQFDDNRTKYVPRAGQVKAEEESLVTPSSHFPEQEWMEAFLSDFKELREALEASDWRAPRQVDQPSKLPHSRDVRAWECFCLGGKVDDAPSTEDGVEEQTASHGGNPPLVSTLATLDEVRTAALLQQMVKWVESAPSLSEQHAQWMFSLLCTLSTPIDASTAASLRALVRWCYKRRALAPSADPEVERCNILLAIAGRHFSQGGDVKIVAS
uniref:Gem-associated protein 2 n=1 Tax=Pyramimonas obovata TaxID=1411642 RepID=A0A7S0WV45_9CHLO|mmetsp:Transcript_5587/g.11388  ORF Transcript_5587/g.11388 Transcript_5587/m.11388 type:complete len:295 (+) Transcript_5587:273-1157(+)